MIKEKNLNLPSSIKIIIMGNFIINFPVIIIIITSTFLLSIFELEFNIALIIGVVIGWIAWNKLFFIWKKWAFKRDVMPEKLYKLGMIGLINFSRRKIFE